MKYLFFILSVATIISCKKDKPNEFFPAQKETVAQVFNISTDQDTVLTAKEGTTLRIKANSFQTESEEDAKGQVQIIIKEFYTIEDFINNRLSTNTVDGKILRSSGMLFIQAKSSSEQLKLKEDQSMTIMFPRVQDSRTANLFVGENGPSNEIRWNLLEPVHNDTTVIRTETLIRLGYDYDDSLAIKFEFIVGSDTIELTSENEKDFKNILRRISDSESDMLETGVLRTNIEIAPYGFYVFETTNLGFINCDIFINDELYEYVVKLDNSDSDVFIVLDSLNSVLYPDSVNKEANAYVFSIPKEISISVVAYRKLGNSHYLGIEKTKSNSQNLYVNQFEMPLRNVTESVKRLESTPN